MVSSADTKIALLSARNRTVMIWFTSLPVAMILSSILINSPEVHDFVLGSVPMLHLAFTFKIFLPKILGTGAKGAMLNVVLRTLRPDEKKVVMTLIDAGGRCLQKQLVTKTNLSKVKVHRVVRRLSERGIVEVESIGKAKEIKLSSLLC